MDKLTIGAMIVARDDVATLPFVVGAALKHLDYVVYIDTGSVDCSNIMLMDVFHGACKIGKLRMDKVDIGPNLNMGLARTKALDILKELDCDWFIKLDGDDVPCDLSLRHFVDFINTTHNKYPDITHISANSFELYQHMINTTQEFWQQIMTDIANPDINNCRFSHFQEMTKLNGLPWQYGCDRAYKIIPGIEARGDWTNESRGLAAENIYYPYEKHTSYSQYLITHYGWARPMNEKVRKARIRYGEVERWNPRVHELHLHPHRIQRGLVPFKMHPLIFKEIGERVMETYARFSDINAI